MPVYNTGADTETEFRLVCLRPRSHWHEYESS